MARRQTWDLSTETVQANFLAFIAQMRLAGKRPLVQLVPEKRSLDQNSMIYGLYGQIAAQAEDQTVNDIRRECKLNIGVPILRAADPVFNGFCEKALGHLTYEQQLKSMDYVDVTSRMEKEQGTEFIDTVIRQYSQQGYCLLHPSEQAA